MTWYKFRGAYVEGEWKTPFFIEIDAEGQILSVSSSSTQSFDLAIDGYLIPGISNGHSHSFQYAMAGMSERGHSQGSFWLWREQMYELANKIQPDELMAITSQLYMNLLEAGYTSVCEFHYLHHDLHGKPYTQASLLSEVIMRAAEYAGIQLTLIPIYYQQSAPNTPIAAEQRRFYSESTEAYLQLLEQIATLAHSRYADVIVGYGVHSLRAANPRDLKLILSGHWTAGPCHFHASEQVKDVAAFEAAYLSRPIDWLYDNIPLDAHHNLVHATHVSEEEVRKIILSKATVVLCPTTEANLGDGIFPIGGFQANGGSWCVGSDSQVNLNPFIEMQAPELTLRLLSKSRNVFCSAEQEDSGKIIYDQVLHSGRKAAGLDGNPFKVGRLLEGLVIDPYHERLLERPLDSLLGIMCFAPESRMIRDVFCKGKLRVKDGKHIGRDAHQDAYRQSMKSLMQGF